ncbi:MAG: AMP-dependent synthetase, partial [Betaproteobacteria bacterium]
MLPKLDSYESLRRQFRWEIPAFYNVGVDLCDKWATDTSRLALIHERRDGTVSRYTFADLKRLSNRTANLLTARGV